jgi:hypothetical protein
MYMFRGLKYGRPPTYLHFYDLPTYLQITYYKIIKVNYLNHLISQMVHIIPVKNTTLVTSDMLKSTCPK